MTKTEASPGSKTIATNRMPFSPLRYPGGKAKICPFIKTVLEANQLLDGEYVEPYAGGAAVALELLFHEYSSHIHINDVSRPIYAFWKSVLDFTDQLMHLVSKTPVTVASWDKQKQILGNPNDHDDLELGFAAFFLNRTNRSGILKGGIIGGRKQKGPWKIDARYNPQQLALRIKRIAEKRERITVTNEDAMSFLSSKINVLPTNSLIYLDPPYYNKGKNLYLDCYSKEDHRRIAEFIQSKTIQPQWLVSYDKAPAILRLYAGRQRISYSLTYSARDFRYGKEVMFFSDGLQIPAHDTADARKLKIKAAANSGKPALAFRNGRNPA